MDNDKNHDSVAIPSLLGVSGKNYKVMADHPISARPDKSNLSESDARAYADSLRPLGFKNISVIYIAPNENEITGRDKQRTETPPLL